MKKTRPKTTRRPTDNRPPGFGAFGANWVPEPTFRADGVVMRARTHRPKGQRVSDLEVLGVAVQAATWAFAHVVMGEVRRRRIFL